VLDIGRPAAKAKSIPPAPSRRPIPIFGLDDELKNETERRRGRRRGGVVFQSDRQGFGTVNAGVVGGVVMILIAVVWFVVGLTINRIFFYPPIMFVIGVIAIINGISRGGNS
jgi:hypothetical protein